MQSATRTFSHFFGNPTCSRDFPADTSDFRSPASSEVTCVARSVSARHTPGPIVVAIRARTPHFTRMPAFIVACSSNFPKPKTSPARKAPACQDEITCPLLGADSHGTESPRRRRHRLWNEPGQVWAGARQNLTELGQVWAEVGQLWQRYFVCCGVALSNRILPRKGRSRLGSVAPAPLPHSEPGKMEFRPKLLVRGGPFHNPVPKVVLNESRTRRPLREAAMRWSISTMEPSPCEVCGCKPSLPGARPNSAEIAEAGPAHKPPGYPRRHLCHVSCQTPPHGCYR